MNHAVKRLERRYLWTVLACLTPQLLYLTFLIWFIVEAS